MLTINWVGTMVLIALIAGLTWVSYVETHPKCLWGICDKY